MGHCIIYFSSIQVRGVLTCDNYNIMSHALKVWGIASKTMLSRDSTRISNCDHVDIDFSHLSEVGIGGSAPRRSNFPLDFYI